MMATQMHPAGSSHRRYAGFTLIELLVVVAIIAMLISILLPSLQSARQQALGTVCLTRMKGLSTAMHTFKTDHSGFYPDAEYWFDRFGAPGMPVRFGYMNPRDYRPPEQGGYYDAPFGPRHKGSIAKYLAKNIDVYKCPADDGYRYYKDCHKMGVGLEFMALPPRLSYVVNGDLNWLDDLSDKTVQGDICRYTDSILRQSPSKVMHMMEESSYSPINDPFVQWRGYQDLVPVPMWAKERQIGAGLLAWRHNKKGSLLMFDGHAETMVATRFNGEIGKSTINKEANILSGRLFDSLYVNRDKYGGTYYPYLHLRMKSRFFPVAAPLDPKDPRHLKGTQYLRLN